MRTAHHRRIGASRRGTVLVMVLAILAMLFMMGSSLLIVSRFESQDAKQKGTARNMQVVTGAMFSPLLRGLREDLVGSDNSPYNSDNGIWTGDASPAEDFADFVGLVPSFGNPILNGDLVLSSIEPLQLGANWVWYSLSGLQDTIAANTPGNDSIIPTIPPAHTLLQSGPYRDADGDGIPDADGGIGLSIAAPFGGGYDIFIRAIPHGGMVLLDRMTHPALLRQVIRYQDIGATTTAADFQKELWPAWPAVDANDVSILPADDEWKLRRRGFLPPRADTTDTTYLPGRLTQTLGYPASASIPPHWQPVDTSVPGDQAWWVSCMTPSPLGLTETGYDFTTDTYDRRRLVTTINSDDVLRRRRDEGRLKDFTYASGKPFLDILNPPDGSDTTRYGADGANILFNRPGLGTAFSLRDVLDPTTGKGTQQRALQLTAYYLAMLQHTSVPSDNEQLLTAAQLAVNTIDFADVDSTPSYFAFTGELSGGVTINIEVAGIEKQPYLTEAYAQVVWEEDTSIPATFEWNNLPTDAKSLFVVELYNPYDEPIDLLDYRIQITGNPDIDFNTGTTIPAYGHAIVSHTARDEARGGWINLDLINEDRKDAGEVPANYEQNWYAPAGGVTVKIDQNATITLVRRNAIDLATGSPEVIVVDRLAPMPIASDPSANQWDESRTSTGTSLTPNSATDLLVREYSLQRRKDVFNNPSIIDVTSRTKPHNWHFTLARQYVFKGTEWRSSDGPNSTPHNLLSNHGANQTAVGNNFDTNKIAPFQVVTADRGIDDANAGGTLAFPTTGSLLLMTRYAHNVDTGQTMQERATKNAITGSGPEDIPQMQRIDNGHMPVFDTSQKTTDLTDNAGRLDQPWGQLVYDYFTALPLEELVRPVDLSGLTPPLPTDAQFIDAAKIPAADYDRAWNHLFAGYPVVERVETPGGVTIGPRVRGRININFAPWWVLDGLPVLPDVATSLPVPELVGQTPPATEITAAGLVEPESATGFGPTVSPELARAIALYRELRNVPRVPSGTIPVATTEGPGFPTVGKLANVIGMALELGPYDHPPPTYTYLEAVAPLVRLTDWATVKNHAYTLYATIGDRGAPPVWIRTQATVDRTRCMYTLDLPETVSEIRPLGYYNAIADQE